MQLKDDQQPFNPANNFSNTQIVSEEGINAIHNTSLKILKDVGMAFYDEEARKLLKKNGAKVVDEIVYFDSDLIEEYITKTPSTFTQLSRNQDQNIIVGGNHTVFAPVYGPPFVYDYENGRRSATLNDLDNFIKLAQMSPYLHHSGGTVVEPNDLPVETRHLDMLLSHILYSDKAFMGSVTSPENAQDSVEIAKILFGEEEISKAPALLSLINVNSPRQFDDGMLGALKNYAMARQAVIITPFMLAGSMGPVTIAGSIAQQNAEVLAGITYTQMVNPGTPVVYGSFLTNIDMRTGTPVFGSPESQLAIYTSSQLAKKYNLPFRGGGMFTSSKLTDAQAAYEATMTMIPTLMAGVNFVLHSAGWLENGMTAGYEKFLLDSEILGMLQTFLKGLDITEESLAMEAIQDTKPGAHYLGTAHTKRNFRNAFHRANIFDYSDYMQWELNGKKDSVKLANEKMKKMLSEYEAPKLDQSIEEELNAYINQRKKKLLG